MPRRPSSGNLNTGSGLNPFKRSKPGPVPLRRKPSRGPSLSLVDDDEEEKQQRGQVATSIASATKDGNNSNDDGNNHTSGGNVFLDPARFASTVGAMASSSKPRPHTTAAEQPGDETHRQQLFQRPPQNPFATQSASAPRQQQPQRRQPLRSEHHQPQQKPQHFKQQQQQQHLHLLLDGEPLQDLGTDTETDVDDDDDFDNEAFDSHPSLRLRPAHHDSNQRHRHSKRGMAQPASNRGGFGGSGGGADDDVDDDDRGNGGGVGSGDVDDEHIWSTQHPAASDEGTGPDVLTPPGTQAVTQPAQSSKPLFQPSSSSSSSTTVAFSGGGSSTTKTGGAPLLASSPSTLHPHNAYTTSARTKPRKASLGDTRPAPPLSRHSSLDVEGVTRSFGSLISRSLSVSSLSTALPARETRPRVHARSHTAKAEHMDVDSSSSSLGAVTMTAAEQRQEHEQKQEQLHPQPQQRRQRHRRRGGMSDDGVHPPSIFDEVLGTGLKRPEPRVGQSQRQKTATPKPSVLVTSTGPPIDLSLKTKLTVSSPQNLRALCYPARAGKARALHAAMTGSQLEASGDEEGHEDVAETLAHSLHYFSFPDVTVSDTAVEPTFPKGGQEQLDVMRDMWEEAANSLWDGVNEGLCDYFYVLATDFELLLWRRPLRVVLTRTSRGLRRLLDSRGVKYCSPRDGSEEMQQAEEVESELEALQDVFKIRRRPSRPGVGSTTSEILIRGPESIAALRPVITQLLFTNDSARRMKQPPILLSNSPFLNAQLKRVPVRYVGPVLQRNNTEEEVMEISGPLLPRMVHGVLSTLGHAVPQFTVRMTALHYTHQFNTGVQWDKDTCLLLQTSQRGMTLNPDFASTVYMKRVRGYQLQFRKSHGFAAMAPAPADDGSAS